MKIAYVEMGSRGHNLVYLTNLIKGREKDAILIVPEEIKSIDCRQRVLKNVEGKKRSFSKYLKWLNEMAALAHEENADIVHFLEGDLFYRFFGIGLNKFKSFKTVITLHWIRQGFIEKCSIRTIARKVSIVVVHSAFLKHQVKEFGILNVKHIEYPQFNQIEINENSAKEFWGLNPHIKTLACIGSTRYDKGLDVLIEALKKVNHPFQLLVAGQVNKFTEEDILDMGSTIKDKMYLNIHYLSDEELAYAFAASDIIVLPYRKSFNGASGPLGEGVSYNKCILGAGHGNLGYTIKQHHLGYTFESENIDDLARTVDMALTEHFKLDDSYVAYKESLSPDLFRASYAALYKSLYEVRGK